MNDCMEAGGRATTVGALGDAGAIAETRRTRRKARRIISMLRRSLLYTSA